MMRPAVLEDLLRSSPQMPLFFGEQMQLLPDMTPAAEIECPMEPSLEIGACTDPVPRLILSSVSPLPNGEERHTNSWGPFAARCSCR